MRNEVSWQVELTVKPNQLKNFRALTKEMVEFTKSEIGVLVYERYVSEDGMTVFVYERYTDSNSALAHLAAFGSRFATRFSTMVVRKQFTVFGNASKELRSVLDNFNPTYFKLLDGLSPVR